MDRAGMTVRMLELALGNSAPISKRWCPCTVSRYRHGRQLPTPERLEQLASILSVDVDWLAGHVADEPIRLSL